MDLGRLKYFFQFTNSYSFVLNRFSNYDLFFAKRYRHYQRSRGCSALVASPFGRQTKMSWPDNDMI